MPESAPCRIAISRSYGELKIFGGCDDEVTACKACRSEVPFSMRKSSDRHLASKTAASGGTQGAPVKRDVYLGGRHSRERCLGAMRSRLVGCLLMLVNVGNRAPSSRNRGDWAMARHASSDPVSGSIFRARWPIDD